MIWLSRGDESAISIHEEFSGRTRTTFRMDHPSMAVDVEHSERIQALQQSAGSLPFYSRYRQVWLELAALGDAVWLDPVAADALAVCYETMHRARTKY